MASTETTTENFHLDEDFKTSNVVYVSKSNKTMWIRSGGKWMCALCRGKLDLCRGCGGMSSMYEDCFGSCGAPFLLCPNCVCLKGPSECRYFDMDKSIYVEFDSDPMYGWKENTHIEGLCGTLPYNSESDEFTGSIRLSFVTFQPNKMINLRYVKFI